MKLPRTHHLRKNKGRLGSNNTNNGTATIFVSSTVISVPLQGACRTSAHATAGGRLLKAVCLRPSVTNHSGTARHCLQRVNTPTPSAGRALPVSLYFPSFYATFLYRKLENVIWYRSSQIVQNFISQILQNVRSIYTQTGSGPGLTNRRGQCACVFSP